MARRRNFEFLGKFIVVVIYRTTKLKLLQKPVCQFIIMLICEVQYLVDILVSSSYESLLNNSDVYDVIGVNIASVCFLLFS